MKKLILLLFLGMFLVSMASAITWNGASSGNYTSNVTWASIGAPQGVSTQRGIGFVAQQVVTSITVNIYNTGSTSAVLKDASKNDLNSTEFGAGKTATIYYDLVPGTTYYLVVNGTGTWNIDYTGGAWTSPFVTEYINITCDFYNNQCTDATVKEGFVGLNITGTTRGTVSLVTPTDGTITNNPIINFNATSSVVGSTLTNMSLYTNSTGTWKLNKTAITTGLSNSTNFTLSLADGFTLWGFQACASDGTCGFSSNRTVKVDTVSPFIASVAYNATTYEMLTESFSINATLMTSAILNYGGTLYTATINGDTASTSISVPIGIGNKSFYWILNNGVTNSSVYNQTVNPTLFGLCNSTLTIPYINYTFKNETTNQESVTASITSTFTYWLGSGIINKSYTFSNSTLNSNYQFCASPSSMTFNILPSIQYTNPTSVSRTYSPTATIYTNTTTNQVLYLLPTALGIYSRYVTQSSGGGIISGVNVAITRTLGGSTIQVGSGVTDSAGLFAIYLDPTASYSYAFSKTGYNTNSFTLTPNSLDVFTVYMSSQGGNSVIVTNGTSIGTNLSMIITPSNSTLLNNTAYTFGFNVNGNGLTFISMNITNSSGYQLGYAQGVNGLISTLISTGNYSSLIGTYTIKTSTENFTFSKTWIVGDYYQGTYSLFTVMKSWNLYGFGYDYYRIVFIVLTLLLAMGTLSSFEVVDTNESKIAVGVFIIWIFSYVGWLTIPISVINPSNSFYVVNQFANQYLIAIIATAGGIYSLKEWLS